MASIYQRTNRDGTKVWRTVICMKDHPSLSDHFERKQDAEDWVKKCRTTSSFCRINKISSSYLRLHFGSELIPIMANIKEVLLKKP